MKRIRPNLILCLSLILGLLQVCISPSFSQSITPEQTAWQFLSRKLQPSGLKNGIRFDKALKRDGIWVFEQSHPKRFVLVTNSDHPRVIGYSLDNLFFPEDTVGSRIDRFLETLKAAAENGQTGQAFKSTFTPAGPFIQTRWGQDDFFNFYCPKDERSGSGHVAVGCAAVAMGQILRYYGKHNIFLFQVSYEHPSYGLLNATMGNFNWALMENIPLSIDMETSRLLFSLGILTQMSYGPDISTTSPFMMYDGFKKLKYLNAKKMLRSDTEPSFWLQTIYENIAGSKPMLLSGFGHSFVCDGVDAEGMIHLNMGWSGYADGYYSTGMVFGFDITEAIYDLTPYSNLSAPVNLIQEPEGDNIRFSWSDDAHSQEAPIEYRVYLNDTLFLSTADTHISSEEFPPGNHTVRVSSLYNSGESRWIGPLYTTVSGDEVDFEDPELQQIVEAEYARQFSPPEAALTCAQAQLLTRITIDKPVASLKGLESCKNLQVLSITGSGQTLDVEPIGLLNRLKTLSIKNINPENSGALSANQQLIELNLERTPLPDMVWITKLSKLLALSVRKVDLCNHEANLNFDQMESLTIAGCGIMQTRFILPMPQLTSLDLSDNAISNLILGNTLGTLRNLNLAGNRIDDLAFLSMIPCIRSLDLSHNQLTRFLPRLVFNELKSLILAHNQIDTIHFSNPVLSLQEIDLHSNKIGNISDLCSFGPNLVRVNLAENRLAQLWTGSLQGLRYLDISDNRISHLTRIPNHPSLVHLECRRNTITDVYPLASLDYYRQLEHLDITGNPLSTESLDLFLARMAGQVDTLHIPVNPELRSPGYPVPARNQIIAGTEVSLSWSGNGSPDSYVYEVWAGDSPDHLTIQADQLQDPDCSFLVDPDRTYYWAVKTICPDTSFLSGIFSFRTYVPISLPFFETFETYEPLSFLPEISNGWVVPWNDSTALSDGRIVSRRYYEGTQSLSILTRSGIQLPLKHLIQKVLRIKMYMFLNSNSRGCLKLLDINGADLVLTFNGDGKCDICFNQFILGQIAYPREQWFPVSVTAYGADGNMMIRIGSQYQTLPWMFTGNNVCIGELNLSCSSGSFYPYYGTDKFFIDNLEISASQSVTVENTALVKDLLVYPNPADTYTEIVIPGIDPDAKPIVYDRQGKALRPAYSRSADGRIRLETGSLPAGVYYICVRGRTGLRAAALVVSR